MKDRPILYSGPMVRGILEDRKSQTRRIVKYNSAIGGIHPAVSSIVHRGDGRFGFEASEALKRQYCTTFPLHAIRCPYGQPGDRLWCRETWRADGLGTDCLRVASRETIKENLCYRADFDASEIEAHIRWKPSIFMPRWASRITLEVTAVRVERLQEISREDAIAEGIFFDEHLDGYVSDSDGRSFHGSDPRISYMHLWNSINGPGSWDINPWVWVLSFRRIKA